MPRANRTHDTNRDSSPDHDDSSAGAASHGAPDESAEAKRKQSTIEKIKNLPAPIGLLLMGMGVVGLVVPGPLGTPLILAGGLVLAPKAFGKIQEIIEKRYPNLHVTGLEAVERFLADLEKRYPEEKKH